MIQATIGQTGFTCNYDDVQADLIVVPTFDVNGVVDGCVFEYSVW